MRIGNLPTPALVVDEAVLESNIKQMSLILSGASAKLRPHYKSHKCAAIAHRQIASGAIGMTCAKLSEAEDLAFSGIEDILIANQIAEPEKIFRAALLAGKCRLTVCIDNADNAAAFSKAATAVGSVVHCLVEYDIGMRRCGLRNAGDYLSVVQSIYALPNLEYLGIQAYAGYASHTISSEEREEMTASNERKISSLIAFLNENGIAVQTVSGGSTGTAAIKASHGLYTELQAGSYLFMDSTYGPLNLPFQNSLFVLSTVISVQDDAIILDAGVKSLGTDQNPPVLMHNGARVNGRCVLNEEHLKLYDASAPLSIGEKVFIIPGHCCSTVNLYDRMYLFSGDRITDRLEITARGKSL